LLVPLRAQLNLAHALEQAMLESIAFAEKSGTRIERELSSLCGVISLPDVTQNVIVFLARRG